MLAAFDVLSILAFVAALALAGIVFLCWLVNGVGFWAPVVLVAWVVMVIGAIRFSDWLAGRL